MDRFAKHYGNQTKLLLWSGYDIVICIIYFVIFGFLLNHLLIVASLRNVFYIISGILSLAARTKTAFNSTLSYDQAILLAWRRKNKVYSIND